MKDHTGVKGRTCLRGYCVLNGSRINSKAILSRIHVVSQGVPRRVIVRKVRLANKGGMVEVCNMPSGPGKGCPKRISFLNAALGRFVARGRIVGRRL